MAFDTTANNLARNQRVQPFTALSAQALSVEVNTWLDEEAGERIIRQITFLVSEVASEYEYESMGEGPEYSCFIVYTE